MFEGILDCLGGFLPEYRVDNSPGVGDSLTFMTADNKDETGILILGPDLVISSMKSELKFTEQFP